MKLAGFNKFVVFVILVFSCFGCLAEATTYVPSEVKDLSSDGDFYCSKVLDFTQGLSSRLIDVFPTLDGYSYNIDFCCRKEGFHTHDEYLILQRSVGESVVTQQI